MGFDLLLAMLIAYYMTRNTVQDLAWKATGQDPPSYRREQERIKRREARRPITTRREGRKFLVNAFEDAMESAGERRERIHNKRMKRRLELWDREDFVEIEDEAYERNTREPELVPDPVPEPAAGPAASGDPADPNTPSVPEEDPTPTREPQPADAGDITGGAQIIQFPTPDDTANQEDSVSETTSLNAALAYTQTMAARSQEGATGVETSIGGLTAGGVSGPAIGELYEAHEALTLAAAKFQAAHEALVRHIAVQESYNANQDAGNKQFVTAD